MARKAITQILLSVMFLAACSTQPTKEFSFPVSTAQILPTAETPSASSQYTQIPVPVTPAPITFPEFAGLPFVTDRGVYFAGAGACTYCHTNIFDGSGKDVSLDKSWSASMMANSSKDPYWLATVRSEVELLPELQAEVETKCAACHMPMAKVSAEAEGQAALLLDSGFIAGDHPLHNLAQDGISCTVCHQIERDNFGQQDSFSGGFLIDLQLPGGNRKVYGPYQVNNRFSQTMRNASGFVPVKGVHLSQSELCGTCHNLTTPYVDASGQVAGEFHEQSIYSEWLNSAYQDKKECLTCHLPAAQGSVRLSNLGGPMRSPYSQHTFAGGNAYMLNILRLYGQEIGVTASSGHLGQAVQESESMLRNQSVVLGLENLNFSEGVLRGDVVVLSLVGHKFPAGYPSRRAWLHISVTDAGGNLLFESGSAAADGRINGNDNDEDASLYEPHYTVISRPDQVQVYEAIMLNSDGEVTTTLLRAGAYAKDNRLLPQGFDPAMAAADTVVHGVPAEDTNFSAGGDRTMLEVELGDIPGPFTVRVELLYQAIGYRWAQNLLLDQTAEAQTFGRYYNNLPNLPFLVGTIDVNVQP